MMVRTSLAAAGLLASSNAFLMPAGVAHETTSEDIVKSLPALFQAQVDEGKAAIDEVKVDCPGCPVPIPHHGVNIVKTDIPSHLELNFRIDSTTGTDRLLVNDFELYPKSDPFSNTLGANITSDSDDTDYQARAAAVLGYSLRTHPIETAEDKALNLVMVNLQIIEVGNVFVDGIPKVQVKLLKTPTDKLMIGNVDVTAPAPNATPVEKQKECADIICKLRHAIKAHLAKLRVGVKTMKSKLHHCAHHGLGALAGHHGHAHHAAPSASPSAPAHAHDDAHHHAKPAADEEKPRVQLLTEAPSPRTWGSLFRTVASHILLPVAIGIMAGVTASILGMLVGTLIVFLWRTFVRRSSSKCSRSGRRGNKDARDETSFREEKVGLMAVIEEEAPPAYADEGIEVDETKKADEEA